MTDDDRRLFEKSGLKTEKRPEALYKRVNKQQLTELIERFHGLTNDICEFAGCTARQFWNAVDRYGLRQLVGDARMDLVAMAESEIARQLGSDDEETRLQASKFVLERLGKSEGWSKSPEIQ